MSAIGQEAEKLERVYNDMYFGNGKPGITTRMAGAETKLEQHDRSITDIKRMFWTIVLLILSVLGTTVIDIIKGHEQSAPPPSHSFNY